MRPIDADALQKMVTDLAPHPHDKWETIGIWHLIDMARTITLDDLRPKGRWVEKPWTVLGIALGVDIVCSECGEDAPIFTDGGYCTVLTKFCHNCGAMMENGEWEGGKT